MIGRLESDRMSSLDIQTVGRSGTTPDAEWPGDEENNFINPAVDSDVNLVVNTPPLSSKKQHHCFS
jgi:hypothetical protein